MENIDEHVSIVETDIFDNKSQLINSVISADEQSFDANIKEIINISPNVSAKADEIIGKNADVFECEIEKGNTVLTTGEQSFDDISNQIRSSSIEESVEANNEIVGNQDMFDRREQREKPLLTTGQQSVDVNTNNNVIPSECDSDLIPLHDGCEIKVSRKKLEEILIANVPTYISRLCELVFGLDVLESIAKSDENRKLFLLDKYKLFSVLTHLREAFNRKGVNINNNLILHFIEKKIDTLANNVRFQKPDDVMHE